MNLFIKIMRRSVEWGRGLCSSGVLLPFCAA